MSGTGDDSPGSQPPKPKPAADVVLVRGPSDDGVGVEILRLRNEKLEAGQLRPAAPGKPIVGELVRLERRPEHEALFDVEVLHRADPPSEAAAARKGPAKVSSNAYREGWDHVFGSKGPLN